MSESEALLRLQDIDLELMRLHATLDKMPQRAKLAAINKAERKLATQLKTIIGQRKDAQLDLEENEAKHAEVVEKTEKVKAEAVERMQNFRETRDVEAHLTALAKQQEKLEHAYLQQAEALERIQKAEANARALGQKLEAERAAQEESFKQDSADLMAEVRKLEAQRVACATEITDEVMARYQAAAKRFGGLAVEQLHGNVPTTCRVKLQSADFGDLKRGPEISECPYCHRMLVTREISA